MDKSGIVVNPEWFEKIINVDEEIEENK